MGKKGFTLVEVMVVLVVVGILMSLFMGGCYKYFSAEKHIGIVDEIQSLGSGSGGFFVSKDARAIAFSRAVSIEKENGEIITFSTEDRQFATVKKGDKVEVKVFKYSPLNFDKAGTYYGGRLLSRRKVKKKPSGVETENFQ